jgi:hypothetical protein
MAGHVECIRETTDAYKTLVRKPKLKILFGTDMHKWEDNIIVDLKEVCNCVE